MERTKIDEKRESNELNLKEMAAHCFDTLLARLSGKGKPPKYPDHIHDPFHPVFVTWTIGEEDELRGCIGTFTEHRASAILGKYALYSALRDDRFDPIELSEVPELSVGVSLLVNFTKIEDPLAWEVGKHGISIEFTSANSKRTYSSTFLPEVAAEESWD
jgi:uncharacterized protein (TIGR00296 family)